MSVRSAERPAGKPAPGAPRGKGKAPAKRRRWIVFLPLAVFAALAAVFLVMLLADRNASDIPSALIGQPAPETDLPPLDPTLSIGLSSNNFIGNVTLVNIWASWCAPCRQEHPVLMRLAADKRFVVAGFNYKDDPANARGFLAELGDPYRVIGTDREGRKAIDWGVYGVPETFLVDRAGIIRFKHVGPLTDDAVRTVLMPEIEKVLAGGGG
ncbi:MAG: DsbE family thiol:disulfide interchange protein [Rhizobiaceae bacterium]